MKTLSQFLLSILVSNAILLSSTKAQAPVDLTEAEAAALEDKVNNLVRERGVLESAVAVELRSPIESTIVFLVEEGVRVKKGDQLFKLESAAIEDAISIQKTKLAASNAGLAAAENGLKNREISLRSVQTIGEKQVEVADMKLNLFRAEDGEHEAALKNLADKMVVVENHVAAATATLIQTKEREALNSAVVKGAEATLAAAQAKLSVLRRERKLHDLRKQICLAELELALLEHKTNMDTLSNELRSEWQQAKSVLEAARHAVTLEKSKLDSLLEKLDGSVVHAPQDGVVLYPERRRGAEELEPGVTVRERQPILKVADVSKLQVAVSVNETRIGRVKIGQDAVIRFDALIDREFEGKVARINDTPEPTTFLQESGREYKAIVSLPDPNPMLRIGMTAMVDIRTTK